jgi:zona occludens toxin (predicted ATPase)
MSADTKPRRDQATKSGGWWNQTLPDWRQGRLVITNLVSGITTEIILRPVFDDEAEQIGRAERALDRRLQSPNRSF